MKRRLAAAVLILGTVVACSKSTEPVQPEVTQVQLDAVNPTNLTFNATSGLPTEPFNAPVPGTVNATASRAAFPDSLKLTATQKSQIAALRTTFETANRTDIVSLKGIHDQASAAKKEGKSAAEVRAILNLSKPIIARMTARFEALRVSIAAVLTAAQKAWIASHSVIAPPPGWVGPVGPATTP